MGQTGKIILGDKEYSFHTDKYGNKVLDLNNFRIIPNNYKCEMMMEFNPDAKITARDYPRLDKSKAHEYVVGMVEKGNGKNNKTGILCYEQNGYKYDGTGQRIISTGKHVKQKPSRRS